jgi:preprotein translocase subunit SecD
MSRRAVSTGLLAAALLVGASIGVVATTADAAADASEGPTVVLTPTESASDTLRAAAKSIVQYRLALLDLNDARVSKRGNDIVVKLPAGTDPGVADALVAPAELRFRPVLANLPPPASTATTPEATAAARSAIRSCDALAIRQIANLPTSTLTDDVPAACVVLPLRQGQARLLLGPAVLSGSAVRSAKRSFQSGVGNVVDVTLTKSGLREFNELAARSFGQTSPTDELAIVFDSEVQSNPAFQASKFSGSIEISGAFTEKDVAAIAASIGIKKATFGLRVKSVTP